MSILMRNMFRRFMEGEGGEGGAGGGGGGGAKPVNPILTIPDELVPEAWKDHVRDLRRENKAMRELSKATSEDIDKRVSESVKKVTDEYEAKIKEFGTQAEQRLIRAELKASAIKAGMVDLDGLKLADLSTVKLNEDGSVEGADEMLDALKKSKPYLFGSPNNSSNPKDAPNPKTPEIKKATEMSDEEYAAARRKIK